MSLPKTCATHYHAMYSKDFKDKGRTINIWDLVWPLVVNNCPLRYESYRYYVHILNKDFVLSNSRL